MAEVLPDILRNGLIIVFCGTAVSRVSAMAGAYYANPGNAFWRTLYLIGMTPRLFAPQEFRKLTNLRLGLTDLAKAAVGSDRDLLPADYDSAALTAKIERYQPQIVAFTSKRACRTWLGSAGSPGIPYGWQAQMIGVTRLFVLPSPSGAARRYWDLAHWEALASAYWKSMKET